MVTLRVSVKRQIEIALDSSAFTAEDFEIEYGGSGSVMVFLVRFLHNNDYDFIVRENEHYYQITERPGEFQVKEESYVEHFESIIEKLENWSYEVRRELASKVPVYRELDKLRASIEDVLTSSITDEDDEFSVQEINKLKRNFEELDARITELENAHEITAKQKEAISSSIKQVSENVEALPKKAWLKTAANKLAKSISSIATSKEGRAILSDGAKKLLSLD